jgi:ATP-dependent DNA ligase
MVGGHRACAALFEHAVLGARVEGSVAKRLASPYAGGRASDWPKISRSGWQDGRTWRE